MNTGYIARQCLELTDAGILVHWVIVVLGYCCIGLLLYWVIVVLLPTVLIVMLPIAVGVSKGTPSC